VEPHLPGTDGLGPISARGSGRVMPSKRPPNRVRAYHRSGEHTVSRALPYLLERVADEKLPAEQLTPLEAAARARGGACWP
jgi:hypothetical protein